MEVSDEHDVGIDPHKKTLTATVLDGRGGTVATASFKVSGVGHRALVEWATSFGPVRRWGIESASGLGRHTAIFLIERGHDVRDVCPTRTAEQSRKRRQGKTDALDSLRIAREVQADPDLPVAFKRAPGDAGPDETHELLNLWHNQRRSLVKSRQHLLNEADALLHDLPEEIRADLPDDRAVRPRLKALGDRDRTVTWDPVTALRLRLLDDHAAAIAELDAREREASRELRPTSPAVPAPPSASCAGSPTAPTPSCSWRPATPAASPAKAASPASTAPPHYPPPPPKATTNRNGTGSTGAATVASTPCCTAWRSPSCAANLEPDRSMTTPAAAVTPRKKRCGSSNATSPTSSTDG